MTPKLKQCSECPEGKLSILWKSNPPLCRYHAQMRTAKKQVYEKNKEGGIAEKDMKFYKYLWKNRFHWCAECSRELADLRIEYFHHILPKRKGFGGFPYFRYEEENVIILCWSCHQKAESAISYPKMKIYDFCERRKKELLESVGLTYEPKH